MSKLLIIGKVWPEPGSSAAGWRMLDLIKAFLDCGHEVHFACTAHKTGFEMAVERWGVKTYGIQLNDDEFDGWIANLSPDVVMYDRFMTEEQFGWRVRKECEKALTILDTEDLHFVRKGREEGVKKRGAFTDLDYYNDFTKRELASILRCDLSLIISTYEMDLLTAKFNVPSSKLYYLPIGKQPEENIPPFDEREGLVFIGNFMHEPNWDAVLQLKRLWKEWEHKPVEAGLRIYGAYPPQKAYGLNSDKDRFFVMGRAENSQKVIANAKLLLAPLRFGAGLKGKIIEALANGTPVLTTSVGAEGIANTEGLLIVDDLSFWRSETMRLIHDENGWRELQDKGFEALSALNNSYDTKTLMVEVANLRDRLQSHRMENFIGEVLHHHTLKSTEYLSKWIMAKAQSSSEI